MVEACNKDQGCHSTLLYTAGATEQLNARLSSDPDGGVTITEAGATGPDNVIGSRCRTADFALLLRPMTMLLDARDPRRDYVRIPLDQTAGRFTFVANLRARNGMALASARVRADDGPQNPTRFTTLRLTGPAAR